MRAEVRREVRRVRLQSNRRALRVSHAGVESRAALQWDGVSACRLPLLLLLTFLPHCALASACFTPSAAAAVVAECSAV